MGEASRPGCALAIALACGVILLLAALAAAGVFLMMGRAVPHLETSFIRESLDRARSSDEVRKQVEAVLDEYRRAARAAGLDRLEWWRAGRTFERSPSTAILEALAVLAGLDGVERIPAPDLQRGRDAWRRVIRGLAEGKIAPKDYRRLLSRAAGGPEPDEEDPIHIDMFAPSPGFLRKLFDEAARLAGERAVAEGPFEPDLPALIRRDLMDSLKSG
jgi:hypothetical protein